MEQKTVAIVLAAGQGKRMGTKTAKQFLELEGKPVLYYSLKAFEQSEVDYIVLVTSEQEMQFCREEIVEKNGLKKVLGYAVGGKERYHSVFHGLQAVKKLSEQHGFCVGIVLIHDGARPFVTKEMITKLLKETGEYGACVSATPVKDTIKIADAEGFCENTPNRSLVWAVQTPQVFRYDIAMEAYGKLMNSEKELLEKNIQITDDAMVVETMLGKRVKLVEGDYKNIKLTTPEDYDIAKTFLNNRKESAL